MSFGNIFKFSNIAYSVQNEHHETDAFTGFNGHYNFNQSSSPIFFTDNYFSQCTLNCSLTGNASDSIFSFYNTNTPFTFNSTPINFGFCGNGSAPIFNTSLSSFNSFNWQGTPLFGLNSNPVLSGASISAASSASLTAPSNNTTRPIIPSSGPFVQRVVDLAEEYEKTVKTRKYANQLFSGGQDRMWCSDFVGSVVNDVYGNKVKGLPRMGCVKGIWDWGQKQSCNLTIYGMNSKDKGTFIAKNIKPGDIMINRTWYDKDKNGKKFDTPKHIFSHTEIVVEVHADGSFKTVSGGGKSVRYVTHSPQDENLYGFTCLNRYQA